jgi:hypothetical protein
VVYGPTPHEDTAGSLKKFSTEEVDNIFRAMERREKELDSLARIRTQRIAIRSAKKEEPEGFDTSAVPYLFEEDSPLPEVNPLRELTRELYSSRDTHKPVFLVGDSLPATRTSQGIRETPLENSTLSHDLRPDWLLAIVIGSLVLLAWLKLFYNKFMDQTIRSLANYQLSSKLLRDQNIFSRRVAFALNINFVFIGAALVYLVFGIFNIRPLPLGDFLSYLSYVGILMGLLILRYITSHFIGHVFNKQGEFRDYLHQLLLIYKNLGIYLLLLVAGIAYIREDLRMYLVYIAGLMVISAFILRLLKGVKIILNNKDVLIFYLILYLCTLEILPLLIFYRFFSLSVQAG